MKIQKETSEETTFKATSCYYTEVDGRTEGKSPRIHLCGRTLDGDRVHVPVDGFRPYFYISHEEFVRRRVAIENAMGRSSPQLLDYAFGHESVTDDELVRLYTKVPSDVSDVREQFDRTWEADVLFPTRFLIDRNIYQYVRVPRTDVVIDATDVHGVDVNDDEIVPRVVSFDIEVATDGEGIPDYETPLQPITAITAHDNYRDHYWSGVLAHEQWDEEDRRAVENVYEDLAVDGLCMIVDDDATLIAGFIEWLVDVECDVLTGWNSDLFDIPYLINRAFHENVYSIRNLSPTKDVRSIQNAPRSTNHRLKGIECWDLLTAYRKSQIHELKSYSLDSVAQTELGYGKDPIDDIDEAWRSDPQTFVRYNIRDTEAVVEIERSGALIEMYDNIKDLTGVTFGNAHHNKTLVDSYMLRNVRNEN